jgi:hypothetical protein
MTRILRLLRRLFRPPVGDFLNVPSGRPRRIEV